MTPRTSIPRLAALGLSGALAACGTQTPPPAAAPSPEQAAESRVPPPPLPMEPTRFPEFREATLPNGLRMIVVEKQDQPVANVNLYVRSGSSADPLDRVGLTEMVAELLTKGTPTRSAQQISETIEGVGGDLSASSGLDYVTVSGTVLADQLPLAFDLVSDVALRPTFPQEELEIARTRALSALQVELSQPSSLAQRRFIREVYGDENPYGYASLPATVQAIGRADLTRFHQNHFRADNALLVVSGDVDPARVEALARAEFGEWKGGFSSQTVIADPPARERSEISLVHRPGSVQSNILVGHVGIRPDNPDYYPLQVLNKIVGGGTDSRLFTILREEKGWTYGAYSQLSRPEDVGYFAASAEVRTEVTDSALTEMLTQLRRVREEPVSQQELEAAKSFLVGSFPLRIETAGQIASQVAQTRLLGLPTEALLNYRDRIAAVTVEDVQRVAREYVRPDRAAIVVVGDATKVLDGIDGIAPVTLFDTEGKLLERSALEVHASTETFDASALQPMTLTYQVLVQGNPLGTATGTLAREGEAWVGSTTLQVGPMNQRSEVRFTNQLAPISSTQTVQGPAQMESSLRFEGGRVTGTAKLPPQMGGDKTINAPVVRGTISDGMEPYLLASADLQPGKTITVPVFSVQSGSAVNQTFTVTGTEAVTVPAGTFETYRVEFSGGEQSGVIWVRQEAPHVVVKQEFAGQPIAIVLQAMQ